MPFAATFHKLPEPVCRYAYRKPIRSGLAGIEWLLGGTGVASSNHFEVGGFIRSKPGLTHPDLQYHFIPAIVTGQLEIHPEHGYQAHCGTMRPESRGEVRLTSADIFDAPLIDPNFLATKTDIEDMRAGVRHTVEILEQSVMKDSFALRRFKPTEEELDLSDDDAVDAWVRANSHSAYHLSCTCAMGTVVDASGRVIGLEGVRVADASIMPSMTSGNLNAPTIMLAEKIADAVRDVQLPPAPLEEAVWYQPPEWQLSQR
jgi:choline dehydrogenase